MLKINPIVYIVFGALAFAMTHLLIGIFAGS